MTGHLQILLGPKRSDTTVRMRGVYPEHRSRFFNRFNSQVYSHGLTVTAAQYALQRFGWAGIDLLMRHVGRHVNKIARSGLGSEFKVLAQRMRARPLIT